jgi:hypothetical protein
MSVSLPVRGVSGCGGHPGLAVGERDEGVEEVHAVFAAVDR